MRFALAATVLVAALWLGLPAHAVAQDPAPIPVPVASPPPPPPPPPTQDVAVPRVQDAPKQKIETQNPENRAPENRAPERGADRMPIREPRSEGGGSRRDVVSGDDQAVRRPAAPAESANGAREERGGAERRGAVRRAPSGTDTAADRAIPRADAPAPRPGPNTRFDRYYYYPNYSLYYDPWGFGAFGLGYFYYSPWTWYPNVAYGYGGYPQYPGPSGYDLGSVKLKVKPRDAEVWVDGFYAGTVDDFDGIFQALKLDSGAYRIEVRKPGFEPLRFDVRVQPDRTITFRGDMKPIP